MVFKFEIVFDFMFLGIGGSLNDALKNFETFHHDSIRHRITKRDVYTQYPNERQVEYDSQGRLAENCVNFTKAFKILKFFNSQ